MDVVLSGYGIRVAQGTYRPNDGVITIGDERELTFQLKNNVTVKGGYAGYGEAEPNNRDIDAYETILSGDLLGNDVGGLDDPSRDDNSYHVVTGNGTDATAVLDGFTITSGNTGYTHVSGGGMYNNEASPTITNCTFIHNSASGAGGGMANLNNSCPTVANCTFYENEVLDILLSGGGGGGICNDSSNPVITNCLFVANISAASGGAIANWWSANPTISNCTFNRNSAIDSGGLYNYFDCSPIVMNCIFWGDIPDEICTDSGYPVVTYSDVQGGWAGMGNIDVDPLFVDPCDGDFHLKSEGWRWYEEPVHESHWWCDHVTSACIDAGNPGSPLGDELLTIPDDPNHEWGENLRINMGAYGGTAEASMPPYGWALLGDLTNDGTVSYADLAGQVEDWLTTANEQPGDLDRNGIVNIADYALLAQDWLQLTDWANRPPEVYITEPEDGYEFSWLTESVWIRADASDTDGSVVKVEFFVNESKIGEDNDGGDGWEIVTSFDVGTYILTARATDDEGTSTTSPPVTITAVE